MYVLFRTKNLINKKILFSKVSNIKKNYEKERENKMKL